MKTKNIVLLVFALLFCITLLCACDSKASLKSEIAKYDDKISSLNSYLDYYQDIYDRAQSTYKEYSIYSGKPEWDSELSRTKDIMDEAKSKIAEIEREIVLNETFKKAKEKQLEKYD